MELIISPAISLDGFIADVNGECYNWILPADEARYEAELLSVGCELIGRKTYELRKDYYDARTHIFTFVYTSQHFDDKEKVKFVHGTPNFVLDTIEKQFGFNKVIACGGGETLGAFAAAGLVTEIYFSIHPIILGAGVRLFGSYKPELNLKLIDIDTNITGVTRTHYLVIK